MPEDDDRLVALPHSCSRSQKKKTSLGGRSRPAQLELDRFLTVLLPGTSALFVLSSAGGTGSPATTTASKLGRCSWKARRNGLPRLSHSPPSPNGERMGPRVRDTQYAPPLCLAAALAGTSTAEATLSLRPGRSRSSSAASGTGGAVLRSVLPGVLVFPWLHLTEANDEVVVVALPFPDEAIGRTPQVSKAGTDKYGDVFRATPSNQLIPVTRPLRKPSGGNTIMVASSCNQDEGLSKCEAFERGFPSEPALANHAASQSRTS
ncbi:hypothetical protein HPB50_003064 [Hyalomma asiaticum]|uniref:Uncharacterized protein n=1 Tax=Hyalomma asiaticum TaxID=266040 RepID=A0ACB7T089_HYAAI|nr:hypothetical protein HPB50_003064 [Hyalomma asiaticum]